MGANISLYHVYTVIYTKFKLATIFKLAPVPKNLIISACIAWFNFNFFIFKRKKKDQMS